MLSTVSTASLIGLESCRVEVEVDTGFGLPNFTIVGLGATAIQESRERVRSALKNSNLPFPVHRITVNLAPAHLRKDGAQFDLPIAVGIMVANEIIPRQPADRLFLGELSLDGRLRSTNGLLAICLAAEGLGYKELYIPAANAQDVAIVQTKSCRVYPVNSLLALAEHLCGDLLIEPIKAIDSELLLKQDEIHATDFADIKGQLQAKRCLEIAAAGAHNVLLSGPPGSGKTLLARTLPTILPKLTFEEALTITKLYSIAQLLPDQNGLIWQRPFRAPHHTASAIAIIGGGSVPRPGDISLAHRGVLFFDELPEFATEVIEVLRQPLEDRQVTIARASGSVTYPADFIFIAARNPCPCGYYGSPQNSCQCSSAQVRQYRKKVSGPLLDRIDLHLTVHPVTSDELTTKMKSQSSNEIRRRVQFARQQQGDRFKDTTFSTNAAMNHKDVVQFCHFGLGAKLLLKQVSQQYQLSARSFYRVIKVAQTIADLEGSAMIEKKHIAEACNYRPLAS